MSKTKEEQFIWNIREAMRFVKMGSGSKHEGVFNILEPIIEVHIKQFLGEEWICERCKATYAEYVNGCPKCATGEVGGSAKVVRNTT